MKKITFILFFNFLVFIAIAQTGTIKIVIPEIHSKNGNIKVALYNVEGKKGFLKDLKLACKKKEAEIKNGSAVIVFSDIPYGIYAVSLFQDENNNGKIDRAVIGFPIEPYGISGNKNTLGPPSFNDAEFEINTSYKILNIRLKTWVKTNVE